MRQLFLRRPLALLTATTLLVLVLGGFVVDRGWPAAEAAWAIVAIPLLLATFTLATWRAVSWPVRLGLRRREQAEQRRQALVDERLQEQEQERAVAAARAERVRAAERTEREHRQVADQHRVTRARQEAAELEQRYALWALESAEAWAEEPTDPDDMPFRLNPPAGWPAPAGPWLPEPGWTPPGDWPAVPDGWELWLRTVPRRRELPHDPYGPAPTWTSHAADVDEDDVRAAAALSARSPRSLRRRASVVAAGLAERRRSYALERGDRQTASARRSPWHPLEDAYRRALDGAEAALEAVLEALRAAAPEDGVVQLWRELQEWLDEVADADRDRTAQDTAAARAALLVEFDGDWAAAGHAWQQAEELAAATLREWGYDDARVTPAGTDRGLDVTSRSVVAQVKYWDKPIGRPALQQLAGAAGGRLTAFFSRAGFTAQAVDEADRLGMALFRIALPARVTPVNDAARRLQG